MPDRPHLPCGLERNQWGATVAVDEARRRQLREQLTTVVGAEATATMFELLPPAGEEPATARQVTDLSARMDRGFEHVDSRIDGLDQRIGGLDQRIDGLDQRIDGLDQRIDGLDQRIGGLEHRVGGWELRLDAQTDRLTAVFRQELLTAVTGQTRAILLSVLTTLVGTATLALAFAQLT
jgi:hypothetical protein